MPISKSISINESESSIILILPEEYRNYIWSNQFGPYQSKFRELSDKIKYVGVNAVRNRWVDPFPILSLIISLTEISSQRKVCYIIPNLDNLQFENKRVLEFLAKEGFLNAMQKAGIFVIEECKFKNFLADEDLNDYSSKVIENIIEEFNDFVVFSNSTILEATITDLSKTENKNSIDDIIDRDLDRVKHRILAHLPGNLLNEIIWKIGLFLKETINNVYEHAYEHESTKYVGYYIRHRIGLLDNSLNLDNQRNIKQAIIDENKDLSRLVKDFPMGVTNFIEIFVIDSGIGLTSHYTTIRRDINRSFRETWRETVGLGNRSVPKNTQFGGLYTLGKLLKDDFILARDYDFWIGDILPIIKENASYCLASNNSDPKHYVKGLALMSRIAMKNPMDNEGWILSDECHRNYIEAMKEEKGVYEKYYKTSYRKLPTPLSYIKDDRFELTDFGLDTYLEQKTDVQFCIFLPSEHISKNGIFNNLDDTLLELSNISNKSRSVIIADIPVCECGLYQYAIEKAKFDKKIIGKIDRIILLSQRLSVRILIKDNNKETFIYSEEETKKYIQNKPSSFEPHLSHLHLIEWLKTHDSMLLWQYIKHKNSTEDFYINQEIVWYKDNDDKTLNGYLDFEKTLTDIFLKKIYKYALERTLCLAPEAPCNYIAEDPLMIGLTNYMNTLYYNHNSLEISKAVTITLGSVFVSGLTQINKPVYDDSWVNINMFLHKGSNMFIDSNTVMHLFAWPEKDLFLPNKGSTVLERNYRRVGSTYAIAPFGWRYFPIPRYKAQYSKEDFKFSNNYFFTSEEARQIEFKSIYKCLPKETYNYWQGKNGVFVGISHIDYETKHDILNINFPFIVRESFLLGGDLACFLLGEIVLAMDLNKDQIDYHKNEKLKQDVDLYCRINEKKYINRKCSLIVYPYHLNTEQIMDIIKEYTRENIVKMIPLIPLNKERNGTCFQPSPLTIEMLKREIVQQSTQVDGDTEINVLLCDDAIIDGKTQEEIKHILLGLGVKHVMSLFLLERRRLPFNTSDCKKTSVFWRLDIPRLGSKYNCPLCSALNSISDFSSQIISDNAKKRVNEWIDAWSAKTENMQERIHTITPMKLNFSDPAKQATKRFGIYFEDDVCKQCGGDSNKIELFTSLGLTLYMGELLSITSRDDKMLQYCSEEYKLNNFSIIEMLCTNLLLYGNTICRKVREKIILQIFNSTNEEMECNNHTAFAALVLMVQEKEVLLRLKEKYIEMKKSNKDPNYDMLILFSYLGVRHKNDFGEIEAAKRLRRASSMSEDGPYRIFHAEIFNGDGNTHNRPIRRLLDGAINNIQELKKVEDALDCLSYSLEYIHDWEFSTWNSEKVNLSVQEAKELIVQKKKILKDLTWDKYLEDKDSIQKNIKEISDYLSQIHDLLFIPLNLKNSKKNIKNEFRLFNRVQKWQEEKKYDIGLFNFERHNVGSSHIYERWIIWDRTVDEEMTYLLDNAYTYSGGNIRCPFKNGNCEEHRVWLSLDYDENLSTMSLLMYNKKKDLHVSAQQIKQETAKKKRYGIYRFMELGVQVNYEDYDKNIIITKVTFQLI